ncbi:MAG: hypothetical protein ACLTUL_14775 [Blautia faecis]
MEKSMPLLHIQIHSHPQKVLNKTSFYGLGVKTIEILGVFGYGLKLPPKTAHSPFISAYKSQKYMQKKSIGAIQSAFSISEKSTAPFT